MVTQKACQSNYQGSKIEIIKADEMVYLVVEKLSDIRSNDVKDFQPILEKIKDMFNISKNKIVSSKNCFETNFTR